MAENPSSVIFPPVDLFGDRKPILALFDLDRFESDVQAAPGVADAIGETLARARRLKLPIAHLFLKDSEPASIPKKCRPLASEMTFERSTLSCFSAEYFVQALARMNERKIVFAGVGLGAAIASLADARDMGFEAQVLMDRIVVAADGSEAFEFKGAARLIADAGLSLPSDGWPFSSLQLRRTEAV